MLVVYTHYLIDQWSSIGGPRGRFPKLLFLHYVFWLGANMYRGTCLHASNTQTTCYWATHCECNF